MRPALRGNERSARSGREWLLLIPILLLAAGLRLTQLGLAEFKYDEATTARSALSIVRDGELPALGMISSLGPHNPPLMSYVLAVPFAVSPDPRVATGWIALLGVVAVGLTFWIGRAYFGPTVGGLAALLLAASPWAVLHSRKVWAQNLPLLTLLFIAAVLALIVRRKPWALTGALAAAGGLVGLHLGGLAFVAILCVLALLFLRRIRPLPLLVGLILFALILGPYVVHDAQHGWPNLRAFGAMATSESTTDLQAARVAAMATGGYHLEDLAGERHAAFTSGIVDLRWLDQVEMALLWVGAASVILRVGLEALQNRGRLSKTGSARLVLLCWLCVPVGLLLRHSGAILPHALSVLYPVQHLTVALLLADAVALGRSRWGAGVGRVLAAAAVMLTLAVAGWQTYLQKSLLAFVDEHDTPGGYGAPVKDTLAAARRLEALAAEFGGAERVVLLPGADPRYDGQAAVFDVLLGPGGRFIDGRAALVFPARPAVYLADPGAGPAIELLARVAAEAQPSLPVRTGSDAAYRFFYHERVPAAPPQAPEGGPARWASGVALAGYDWSGRVEPGGSVRWTLYLVVEGEPTLQSDLHWFNHLIDSEGNRWGQRDGVGFPAAEWRVGDTALIWFDIEISPDAPPPPYAMRVGMYTYPDIVNVSLLDAVGNPAGEFIELGPIGAP